MVSHQGRDQSGAPPVQKVAQSGSKRVAASKRKREEPGPSPSPLQKLLRREVGHGSPASFLHESAPERFSNFQLQEEYDTHDPAEAAIRQLRFLQVRTRVVEIVAAEDCVFVLTYAGICSAFSRGSHKRYCYLNIRGDEVIRALFYNRANKSIITVSVYESDNYTMLKCRSTPILNIKAGKPEQGVELFPEECLQWPGFVEFDDINSKLLVYSVHTRKYTVYDMESYRPLYEIQDDRIQEVKVSPGILMLVLERSVTKISFVLLSIKDGKALVEFEEELQPDSKVDFTELFNDKLLLKQEGSPLWIRDVRTRAMTTVEQTHFQTPTAFVFLYENQLFLTFRDRTVAVWDNKGELVTTFEDHLLWHPDCHTNHIYITSDQQLIISYCKEKESENEAGPPGPHDSRERQRTETAATDVEDHGAATINISHIVTGRCLAKIKPRGNSSQRLRMEAALSDVTALFYDEHRREIYTGNSQGLLHVWSN